MFTVGLEVHDGIGSVRVAGDLDHGTSDDVRCVVLAALSDGASSLVLDCSDLTFIDSTGLTVLVDAERAARALSGTLTIRNPSALVVRLLHMTRLDDVVLVETDVCPAEGAEVAAQR
jgi:anti-sigma B factor antagonist